MGVLVNIGVPDLGRGIGFYESAFGLTVSRRFAAAVAELSGWPVPVYLLEKPAGSIGAGDSPRHYDRHWTPVHLDVVIDDIAAALARAMAAGAHAESEIRVASWGKLAVVSDPFGHGLCLIDFLGPGDYEIAEPSR